MVFSRCTQHTQMLLQPRMQVSRCSVYNLSYQSAYMGISLVVSLASRQAHKLARFGAGNHEQYRLTSRQVVIAHVCQATIKFQFAHALRDYRQKHMAV